MSSNHSSDTLPEPTSPAPDLDEETVFVSIIDMIGAVSKEQEFVLDLPRTIHNLFGRPPGEILITDHHSFYPLPAPDFMTLHMVLTRIRYGDPSYCRDALVVPTRDDGSLTKWAGPLAAACLGFTVARDHMWMYGDKRIQCAGHVMNTPHELSSSVRLLEDNRGPAWHPTTFLGTTTHIIGYIVTTDTNQRLTCEQVLRSELLTILLLLQLHILTVQSNGKLSITETVFLLSFTHTEVRCLEAHIEAPGKVVVSVRQVLDQYPTGPEREETFRTLLTWAMVTPSRCINLCAVLGVLSVSADDDDTDDEGDVSHKS
ncbi:hypothetical protein F4680DRAFT_449441 [Xylaria scruposa]|nr:hypothetical protein F4680DRAFT_449441 [Xylaria scruposa]